MLTLGTRPVYKRCLNRNCFFFWSTSAVPGEVADVKAVETTNDSIKLAWTPPRESGGKPITHYLIEKCDVTSGLAAATW